MKNLRSDSKKNWLIFLNELTPQIKNLKESNEWKEDFVALYGFVWARWYQKMETSRIISELSNYIAVLENKNSEGIIKVKVIEDKRLRLSFKNCKQEKNWQKILFSRLEGKDNVNISKSLNISIDFHLSEKERKLLNEDTSTNRL